MFNFNINGHYHLLPHIIYYFILLTKWAFSCIVLIKHTNTSRYTIQKYSILDNYKQIDNNNKL